MKLSAIFGAVAIAVVASAQTTTVGLPEYAQCGGLGFTGATVCQDPYACVVLNVWYSQCQVYVAGETTTPLSGGEYYRK
ncbi:hypothetical protein DL93DRAFT_2070396 [Clavulina sp. PMI_390]|nr:hypothetical protein DL93DRAFT_2070396 [Clavulina sp. PMI_390]